MPQASSTTYTGIDERLLAGKFREEKRRDSGSPQVTQKQVSALPQSLRQAVLASRAQEAKQRLKDRAKQKIMAPSQAASGAVLRWAWMLLTPTFGLSLIYINIHAFFSVIFPNAVCQLGQEWLPPALRTQASKTAGIIEWGVLFVLDLGVLLVIISILAFLAMIVSWMNMSIFDKLGTIIITLKGMLTSVAGLGWEAISSLVKLFQN